MPGLSLGLGIGLTRQRRALSPAERLLSSLGLLDRPNIAAVDWRYQSIVVHRGGVRTFNGDTNDFFTNTAPPTQYIRNSSGVYVQGTTLRTHHDADGNPLGLLVEEQRTNIMQYSLGDAANLAASLTAQGTSSRVAAPSIACPDGNTGSAVLVSGANAFTDRIEKPFGGAAASNTEIWSASCFLKSVSGTQNGFIGAHCIDDANYVLHTITDDQWTPVSATQLGTGTETNRRFRLYGFEADFYMCIPRLEAGASASSPIKTTGSQVTRAANDITLPLSLIPDVSGGFSGVVSLYDRPLNDGTTRRILSLDDGTGNNRINLNQASAGDFGLYVVSAGSNVVNASAAWSSASFPAKIAFRCYGNDWAYSINGGAVATDTSGSVPAGMTTLRIGGWHSGGGQPNSILESMLIVPEPFSDAELQALAA